MTASLRQVFKGPYPVTQIAVVADEKDFHDVLPDKNDCRQYHNWIFLFKLEWKKFKL